MFLDTARKGALGLLLGLVVVGAWPAQAQERISMLPDTRDYDWTAWIEGEWEGWIEGEDGEQVPQRQSFEYIAQGRYILTKLARKVGDGTYHGAGIFKYDPVRGLSEGEWFGILGDRNLGLGRRDGDSWAWDIQRLGRDRVLRVRTRVSDDEYHVLNTTIRADGTKSISREVMTRMRAHDQTSGQ